VPVCCSKSSSSVARLSVYVESFECWIALVNVTTTLSKLSCQTVLRCTSERSQGPGGVDRSPINVGTGVSHPWDLASSYYVSVNFNIFEEKVILQSALRRVRFAITVFWPQFVCHRVLTCGAVFRMFEWLQRRRYP
jgi:hypothetical protein